MHSPILSICIPTYNRAPLLARLLSNIFQQIPDDGTVEVVVSDNCSDDSTKAVLEQSSVENPHLRWVTNSTNVGLALNIVNVTNIACGQYCLWVGDDDVFVNGALRYYISQIREHMNCEWLAINFYEAPHRSLDEYNGWDLDFCRQQQWKLRLPGVSKRTFGTLEEVIETPGGIDVEFFFAFFACIFRRGPIVEAFSKLDPQRCTFPTNANEGWKYTEEAFYPHTFLWIEALRRSTGVVLPEPLYVQGIGTTRGDDSGKVSFAQTTMPNLRMWVYPQIWSHLLSRCTFTQVQRNHLLRRFGYPCIGELQGRSFRKERMFASKLVGLQYIWKIRRFLLHNPIETVKFMKNLLPTPCINCGTTIKALVIRFLG
jgi:hypothetical protein